MSFLCGGCINDEEEKQTQVNLVEESIKEAKLSVQYPMLEIMRDVKDFPVNLFEQAMMKFSEELKSKLTNEQLTLISKKSKQWSKTAKFMRDSLADQSNSEKHVDNPIYLVTYTNKSQYYGQIKLDGPKLGSIDGVGVIIEVLEDESVLVSAGLFKEKRKPMGEGLVIWQHGDYFLGRCHLGIRLAGEYHSKSENRTYYGGFDKFGRIQGEGKVEYTDGSDRKYEGEFKEGKPHGQGKFFWKEGNTYTGDFVNGKQHGFGQLYIKDKGKVYETHWQNGILQD